MKYAALLHKLMLALLIMLGLSLSGEADNQSYSNTSAEKLQLAESVDLFSTAIQRIRHNYIRGQLAEYKKLTYIALQGVIESLDDVSEFLSPEDYADLEREAQTEFGGIGININVKKDGLTIVRIREDTPASRAGLLQGDRILEINGNSMSVTTTSEAAALLRGEAGTVVNLKIFRTRDDATVDVRLAREIIRIPTITAVQMLRKRIGYVLVAELSKPTADELGRALNNLVTNDMQAFILDLRWTPDGPIDSAVQVVQMFINKGDRVMYIQGNSTNLKEEVVCAQGDKHYLGFPMVVMVDRVTMGAPELVAGALQDHRRAILLGEKTFGKGSIQSLIPLNDGSALRLTTGMFYTPNHRVIEGNGIEPDVKVSISRDQWRQLLSERFGPKSSKPFGTTQQVIDIQLDRAVDLLLKKTDRRQ